MMQHEYEREIRALVNRMRTAETDITSMLAVIQIQQKQIEELYGQTDKPIDLPEKGKKPKNN